MSVSIKSTANPGDDDEGHSTPVSNGKREKGVEASKSVNMHQLGVNFVERVRRLHTSDGKTAAPGESLEILDALLRLGLAIGGSKAEKSTTATAKRHWATSCVGACSRNRRIPHPKRTLCEGDPGARR